MTAIAYQLLKSAIDPVFAVFAAALLIFLLLLRYKGDRWLLVIKSLLAFAVIFIYILGTAPARNLMFYALEKDYFKNEPYQPTVLDAVVVLAGGCSRPNERTELMPAGETPARLLHGIQLFRRSRGRYFVVAGTGRGGVAAEAMAEVAKRMGIPQARIVIDDKSRNTYEHAVELDRLIEDKDLRIGIVTHAYHMARACREFRKYFNDIRPFAAEYYYDPRFNAVSFVPGSADLYRSGIALRELAGNLYYRCRP